MDAFQKGSVGVVDVRIAKDQEGNSRGFGHVDFDTPDNANKALSMAGTKVDGRPIRCDLSQPRTGGGGGRGGDRGGFGGGRGGGGDRPSALKERRQETPK